MAEEINEFREQVGEILGDEDFAKTIADGIRKYKTAAKITTGVVVCGLVAATAYGFLTFGDLTTLVVFGLAIKNSLEEAEEESGVSFLREFAANLREETRILEANNAAIREALQEEIHELVVALQPAPI